MTPDDIRGRIIDLDSHLMLFPHTVEEILGTGPGGRPWRSRGGGGPSLSEEIAQMIVEEGVEPSGAGRALDARRERARADVWGVKLWGAHGAQILADRVDALDQMGVRAQLVFSQFMEPPLNADCPEGPAAIARYNDHVLDWAKESRDRVVPICMLNTWDREIALAEASRVLDRGASGLHLSGILPPAGLSPAGPEWEPLWGMLEEAGVPALLHYGGTGGFRPLIDMSWYVAAHALRPPPGSPDHGDFHARPFIWMTAHLYAEVTLTFLVLGGVFERHPGLRFGVIESGASWVPSWCARMDTLADTTSRYLSRVLSAKPSEYVRRQVRVTPFPFEPVGDLMRNPEFEGVYSYSSDYPHLEGGETPIERFLADLEPLGNRAVERFFVENGAELLPKTVASPTVG